jgi:hypothetical protein
MKKILLIAFLAILSTTPAYAEGRHGGGHGGGGHGGGGHGGGGHGGGGHYGGGRHYGNYGGNFGWWWLGAAGLWYFTPGPYYPYPYYPYADPYADPYMPPTPPVVVAPQTNVPPQPSTPSWYFCPAANAYYPYVQSCPGGWQAVPAMPPR